MPDQSPENLQQIVNILLNDLSDPLNLVYNWVDLLEKARSEKDEALVEQCIEGLQSSAGKIHDVWQAMRDLHG